MHDAPLARARSVAEHRARGLTDEEVVEGAVRSTMNALAEATELADKVLVF